MSDQRPTCSACADRKVQHDQDAICLACFRLTRSRLHRVPQLVDDLEVSLARMAVLAERNDGGKSAETALAFTEAAGDALRQIRNVLTGWSRMLHEEQQVPLPQNRLVAMAAHVSVHARKLVAHPAAAEWVAEIRDMVNQAIMVIDIPIYRARVKVGPCPEDRHDEHNDLKPCPGQVIAYFPSTDEIEASLVCSSCETVWAPRYWQRAGEAILQRKNVA